MKIRALTGVIISGMIGIPLFFTMILTYINYGGSNFNNLVFNDLLEPYYVVLNIISIFMFILTLMLLAFAPSIVGKLITRVSTKGIITISLITIISSWGIIICEYYWIFYAGKYFGDVAIADMTIEQLLMPRLVVFITQVVIAYVASTMIEITILGLQAIGWQVEPKNNGISLYAIFIPSFLFELYILIDFAKVTIGVLTINEYFEFFYIILIIHLIILVTISIIYYYTRLFLKKLGFTYIDLILSWSILMINTIYVIFMTTYFGDLAIGGITIYKLILPWFIIVIIHVIAFSVAASVKSSIY